MVVRHCTYLTLGQDKGGRFPDKFPTRLFSLMVLAKRAKPSEAGSTMSYAPDEVSAAAKFSIFYVRASPRRDGVVSLPQCLPHGSGTEAQTARARARNHRRPQPGSCRAPLPAGRSGRSRPRTERFSLGQPPRQGVSELAGERGRATGADSGPWEVGYGESLQRCWAEL